MLTPKQIDDYESRHRKCKLGSPPLGDEEIDNLIADARQLSTANARVGRLKRLAELWEIWEGRHAPMLQRFGIDAGLSKARRDCEEAGDLK